MNYPPDTLGENLVIDFTESDTYTVNVENEVIFLQSDDSVYILKDTNIFNSIFADPDASLTDGTFYINDNKSLTIVKVTDGQAFVSDYYTKTTAGSTGQTLDDETIADVVVNFT